MMQSARWFRLSAKRDANGLFCDRDGLFVSDIPLLEKVSKAHGGDEWQPRDPTTLDDELSDRFGLPVDTAKKIAGITAVARALNKGDLARAQIVALQLQIPDPPPLAKSERSASSILELAVRLNMSGLLKADWDPAKHPRWPAGTAGGIGGEFAPAGSGTQADTSGASLIPAQEVIPFPAEPFELPIPRLGQSPSEILPPPITVPQTNPKDLPTNPDPRNPKCVKEWEEAYEICNKLKQEKKLGRGDDRRNRSWGEFMYQCLMGHVSAECGGNSTNASAITA
jgi:hypothetical protein